MALALEGKPGELDKILELNLPETSSFVPIRHHVHNDPDAGVHQVPIAEKKRLWVAEIQVGYAMSLQTYNICM